MKNLDGYISRLERAREHLQQFIIESDVFLKSKPFGVDYKSITDNGQDFLSLRFLVINEPPIRLGVIAGDCVHNLRSILDNIIWDLGEQYPPVNSRIAFPICETIDKYNSTISNESYRGIKNFPEAVQSLIQELQPYHAGDYATNHPLSILNKIWNEDKHRAPSLVMGVSSGIELVGFQLGQPAYVSAGCFIEDGAEFARGLLIDTGSNNFDVKIFPFIAFKPSGPANGALVANCLYNLHQYVSNLVYRFQALN